MSDQSNSNLQNGSKERVLTGRANWEVSNVKIGGCDVMKIVSMPNSGEYTSSPRHRPNFSHLSSRFYLLLSCLTLTLT